MKRKLIGGTLSLMGAFITAVMIQHHSYDIAALFALATLIITYNFFGESEL